MNESKLRKPPGVPAQPRTPVGKDYESTTKFIREVIEPRIARLVEESNKYLKKLKVQVGVEVNWFIERLEDAQEKKKD